MQKIPYFLEVTKCHYLKIFLFLIILVSGMTLVALVPAMQA